MTKQEIVEMLRVARRASMISQDAVATAIGKQQNDISKYEHMTRPYLGCDTLIAWADTLGYELVLQPKVKP
jgi:transcriptional regulator with XRE-family HTH domain